MRTHHWTKHAFKHDQLTTDIYLCYTMHSTNHKITSYLLTCNSSSIITHFNRAPPPHTPHHISIINHSKCISRTITKIHTYNYKATYINTYTGVGMHRMCFYMGTDQKLAHACNNLLFMHTQWYFIVLVQVFLYQMESWKIPNWPIRSQ